MERFLLTVLAIAFSSVPIGAAPACFTDEEVMAEVALAYLLEQGLTALLCDPILAREEKKLPVPLATINKDIAFKFRAQFSKYERSRKALFLRLHGENWRAATEADKKRRSENFLTGLRLGKGLCRHLREEMEIVFNSNWDYIKRRLDNAYDKARSKKPRCKR